MLAKNPLQNKLAAPDSHSLQCPTTPSVAWSGLGLRRTVWDLAINSASRRPLLRVGSSDVCEIGPWPSAPCETPYASRLTGAPRSFCSWSLDTAASSPHKLFFSAELLSGRILSALGSPSRPFSAQSGHLGDTVSGFPHR
ncbi:uncharacterized protein LOC121467810 [Drosophila elegans]|uniref:uncharacterized protein LOC121467810 n=1 Tax=Drosophila elegans TaxID=30023 RepID=UPI001BC843A6|nr:uncharacterized protein LOC121467810 [Drosophila elegans]